MVEPLVTVEVREHLKDPGLPEGHRFHRQSLPRAPRAKDALVDGISPAFFVWLLHSPESFWEWDFIIHTHTHTHTSFNPYASTPPQLCVCCISRH